jgi:LysM repeat protein
MKNLRQVFLAIIIALTSIGLVLGGFSLSLIEGNISTNLAPTHTLTPTITPTLQPFTRSVDSPTPSPTMTLTLAFTWTPSWTPTTTPTAIPSLVPSPTNCPPPTGWLPYVVRSGDTLEKIATRYHSSVARLQQANCLLTTDLLPGMVLYVPPLPTQTPVSCGRPSGWVVYIIQPGDTLYRLSQAYGISVAELQQANCMGTSTLLHVGQTLYVPPWAPRPPTPTLPGVFTPTATPTITPEISLPSDTPTEIPTSIPTEPPVPTASDTPVVIPTETPTTTSP